MSEQLGISMEEFRALYCKKQVARGNKYGGYNLRTKGACPFYEEGKGCKVYEARPLICRIYPVSMPYLKTVADLKEYGQKIHPDCALAGLPAETEVEPDFELYVEMCAHTSATDKYCQKHHGILGNVEALEAVVEGKRLAESEKFRDYCKKRFNRTA